MKIFQLNKIPQILKLLIFLFVFQALFIISRSALIGSNSSQNITEVLLSILPDLILVSIFIYAFLKSIKIKLIYFDYLITILFASNILLGVVLAQDIIHSIYAIRLSYLPMLTYFIFRIASNSIKKQDYLFFFEALFNWFLIFAILSLVLYLFFPAVDIKLIGFVGGNVNYYVIRRMSGIFFSPVLWGTFMSASAIYTFIKLNNTFKYKDLIIFAIFWFSMILSVSRGAIVSYYIGAVIVCLYSRQYKPFLKSIAVSCIVFTVYTLFNPMALSLIGFVSHSSVAIINDSGDENTKIELYKADSALVKDIKSTRIKYWVLSYRDFIEKPSGYGLGKAGHIGNRFYNTADLREKAAIYSTDGWYLKIANETGIWGLFSYFSFFLIHFIFFLKHTNLLKNQLILFSFVIFLMISIQNIMSNVLDFYSFSCFYWLTIALVYNIHQSSEYEHS